MKKKEFAFVAAKFNGVYCRIWPILSETFLYKIKSPQDRQGPTYITNILFSNPPIQPVGFCKASPGNTIVGGMKTNILNIFQRRSVPQEVT